MTSHHELSRDSHPQPERLDPDIEHRTGWGGRGILVSANQGPRLSWSERELVRQLGTKLYGRRKEVLNA